jgi:NCAIR mutase (PurE)-related protein
MVLVTRINEKKAEFIKKIFPEAEYHSDARVLILEKQPPRIQGKGSVLIMSAGTSDIPVAKEALLTARVMGNKVEAVYDVGVAGIHRLFAHRQAMESASVIIVAAGMEGALPSVVGGLVDKPVIGVPTSVGYGSSLGGLTALFAMLNSCSSNVAVVNIDNGFGAGCMASMINRA